MASNTIVVRVLGNTKSLSKSLNKARKDLQGLENINRNIGSAFRVAAIGAGAFGLAAVGAGAIGTAALAGMPALLAGIGIAFAAQSDEVKSAFGDLKAYVLKEGQSLAKPLVQPLVDGAASIREAFDAIAPSLGKVFKLSAGLVDDAFGALPGIAGKIGPVLVKAFKAGEPVLRSLGKGVEYVIEGFDGLFDALTKNGGTKVFSDFGDAFMRAIGALLPVIGQLARALAPIGTEILNALAPALGSLADIIEGTVVPAVESFIEWCKNNETVVITLTSALVGLFAALKAITIVSTIGAALAALTTPVGLVIAGLVLLGIGLATAWKKSETFRDTVKKAFSAVAAFVAPVLSEVKTLANQVITDIKEWWAQDGAAIAADAKETFGQIKEAVLPILIQLRDGTKVLIQAMSRFWNNHGNTILNVMTVAIQGVLEIIGGAFETLSSLIKTHTAIMDGDFKAAAGHLADAGGSMKDTVKDLGEVVQKEFGGMGKKAKSMGEVLTDGTKKAFDSVGKAVKSGAGKLPKAVEPGLDGTVQNFNRAWGAADGATRSGGARVVGTTRNVAGQVQGAARTDLSGIGAAAMAGFEAGIWSAGAGAIAAARSIAGQVAVAARSALAIFSPSRVMRRIGQFTMEGFRKGLEDGRAGIKNTVDKVATLISKFFNKRFKDAKKAARATKNAMKSLENETKALIVNARKRERVYKSLDKARESLKAVRDAYKSYADTVKNNVVDYTSVASLGTAFTSTAMAQQMRARLDKVRQFTKTIQSLIKSGLNRTAVDQLVAAGVEGGLGYATAIAQGGKSAIKELNGLQTEIDKAGSVLGTAGAESMYRAGINMAEGVVKGFERQANRLERAGVKLARRMVQAIKKALGIKSPSRVFQRLGEQTILGMEVGLKDLSGVERATTNIAKAMTNTFERPTLTATAAAGGTAGGNTYHINVNAPATVDKAALGRELVGAIDAYERQGGRKRT